MDPDVKRYSQCGAQSIDRRNFLNTLSASAILTAIPADVIPAEVSSPSSRPRIPLNGEWEHHVNGKFYDTIKIPSSRRPSGFYILSRELPGSARPRSDTRYENTANGARASIIITFTFANSANLGSADKRSP